MRNSALLLTLLAAIGASVVALFFLVDYAEGRSDLLLFFAAQAIASALLALGTWGVLPPAWRQPRRPVLALLFCFSFFIPLFGAAGMLLAVLFTLLVPKTWRYRDFGAVAPLEYAPPARENTVQLRISSLRTALLDPTAPADVRLRSLVAMQTLPMRTVGPLLRRLLTDPSDDLRLLAYGMLDSEEKRINAVIASEQASLARQPAGPQRVNSLRHLAELHWELVYTGLVQGDVRDHALASAARFLGEALRHATQDPGIWLLMGRLRQARGDLAGAGQAFHIAVSCGLEENRALPYLAEIAYRQRDFHLVRDYLAMLARGPLTQVMTPIVRFWTRPAQMAPGMDRHRRQAA